MERSVSVVVVNYFSVELIENLIGSWGRAGGIIGELIVVDNSCSDQEWERLESLSIDRIIRSDANVGFAAALNRGASVAQGDLILSLNPDAEIEPSSISSLAESIDSECRAAGPRLFWDRKRRWLLPPAEKGTIRERLSRDTIFTPAADWLGKRARIRRRHEFWTRQHPFEVPTISGAAMMIDLATFRSLGGMDERYRLYFEEIDFFRRLRASGGRIMVQPSAGCVHGFGGASERNRADVSQWYLESERTFHRKWHGELLARSVDLIGKTHDRDRSPQSAPTGRVRTDGTSHMELAADESFRVAAGTFASGFPEVPRKLIQRAGIKRVFLREIESATAKVLWRGEMRQEEISDP